MCNLYSMTSNQEAFRRLARVMRESIGNLQPLPGIFPDQMAPVVRMDKRGERGVESMRWGFPPPPKLGTRPVTNLRNTASSYWRPWLKPEFRCLVPATSFYEYTDSRPKVPHWFALGDDRPLFAFAGIWRPWTGERKKETREHLLFSFLTTAPNAIVKPIHTRAMPVMLTTPAEFNAWISAHVEEAIKLQPPLPADELKIVATGAKQDATT